MARALFGFQSTIFKIGFSLEEQWPITYKAEAYGFVRGIASP